MEIPFLSAASNPKIKAFRNFNRRRSPDLMLLDGPHLHEEYFKATHKYPTKTLISERFKAQTEFEKFRTWPHLHLVPDTLLAKLSPTKSPSGILSLAPLPQAIPASSEGLTIILENIQDPGNLGTMLRSSNALSVSQVVLLGNTADIWGEKCLRAGMGAQFHIPVTRVENLKTWLSTFQGTLMATDLAGEPLDTVRLPKPLALVFGNEGQGITDKTRAHCDALLKIPMKASAESLNVASAHAILCHEWQRQQSNL